MPLIAGAVLGAGALVGWMSSRSAKKNFQRDAKAREQAQQRANASLDLSAQAQQAAAAGEAELAERRRALEEEIKTADLSVEAPKVDISTEQEAQRARRRGYADPFAL